MGVLRKGKALWERATQRFPQLKVKGIRQRWLLNSISAVFLILLLALSSFAAALWSYYYTSTESDLSRKATSMAGGCGGLLRGHPQLL